MIKKDLKTLSEVQNPKKNVWRIHLDDGSFIDVPEEERDITIFNLHRQGEFITGYVTVTPLMTAQSIELNFTIGRSDDLITGNPDNLNGENLGKGRKLWNMFKKDVLFWDKALFGFLTLLSVIGGWVTYGIKYLLDGPIKIDSTTEMSFLNGGFAWVGLVCAFVFVVSQTERVMNLLPYISVWVKLLLFTIFIIFVMLSVGSFSNNKADNISSFIGKRLMTKKEHKIMNIIFG